LPASHARDGEAIRPGHIYVAPPDFHMLVRDDRIELSHGPRENHSRPAVDPLFRSAARAYGPGVTGVILSGALGDGAAGLLMIKGRGGTVLVQDPAEAIAEGMPTSALRLVEVDHVLSARGIGQWLASLSPVSVSEQGPPVDPVEEAKAIIHQDFREQESDRRDGQLTMFTCPDCGGTLWQSDTGPVLRFQCHVGHAWGVEALLDQKSENLEAALWTSVRMFEERATLTRQVAARLRHSAADAARADRIEDEASLDEARADAIRGLLSSALAGAAQLLTQPKEELLNAVAGE
jgi:two-component system chemotaxis response regulator CheB